MRKRNLIFIFTIVSIFASLIGVNALALGNSVLISEVKFGDDLSAKNEFIEIYNNTDEDVEVTNWCFYYQSLSLNDRKLTCFIPTSENSHVFLPSFQSSIVISNDQFASNQFFGGDLYFSATLSGSGGYVYLLDETENEIDRVGWSDDAINESFIPTPFIGEVISRKNIEDTSILQDTDEYSMDFESKEPRESYVFGEIYEVFDVCRNIDGIQQFISQGYYLDEFGDCYEEVDYCLNLDDLQLIVPIGYEVNESGDCQPDLCSNLDGIQSILPEGMVLDGSDCNYRDYCPNIEEIQRQLPLGYYFDEVDNCMLEVVPLIINELLPNVDGVDDGKEFIEIYNPNNFEVSLSNYILKFNELSDEHYNFFDNMVIPAFGYYTVYNSEINFILKNTSGGVWLLMKDNQVVDSVVYYTPKEDQSWALIGDYWQYTNQITPNALNLGFLEEVEEVENYLVPCGPNQYRHPETNRCRNIVTTKSTLVPCKDGQYRSEETNRCRSIVSDVVELMPCDEGEERNPETNRCRKIQATSVLGGSTLSPCPEGQERNPETNRCRKVVTEVPEVEYKVDPIDSADDNSSILWWSLGFVGLLVLGYAVWEWRKEIGSLVNVFCHFVNRKK